MKRIVMSVLVAISATVLVSGCATWRKVTPVEVTKVERVPVPAEYLTRHCATTLLSDAQSYIELEETAALLWVCVQNHNKDKAAIEGLK